MSTLAQLDVDRIGTRIVTRVLDRRIIDGELINDLGAKIADLMARERPESLVINFGQVHFLSSSALGRLITLERLGRQEGVHLILTNLHPEIHHLFALTRLNELFDIRSDESEALAAG